MQTVTQYLHLRELKDPTSHNRFNDTPCPQVPINRGTWTHHAQCQTCQALFIDRTIKPTPDNAHFNEASEANIAMQQEDHQLTTGHTNYTPITKLWTPINPAKSQQNPTAYFPTERTPL